MINEFLRYTVELGEECGLVDFKVITIDSTSIESKVDDFCFMTQNQICYLETLIKKYGFSKYKKKCLEEIKGIFFITVNFPESIVDLVG